MLRFTQTCRRGLYALSPDISRLLSRAFSPDVLLTCLGDCGPAARRSPVTLSNLAALLSGANPRMTSRSGSVGWRGTNYPRPRSQSIPTSESAVTTWESVLRPRTVRGQCCNLISNLVYEHPPLSPVSDAHAAAPDLCEFAADARSQRSCSILFVMAICIRAPGHLLCTGALVRPMHHRQCGATLGDHITCAGANSAPISSGPPRRRW